MIELKHGIWVNIDRPGIKDGHRPRGVTHHWKDGQIVEGLFEIEKKLYRADGTPVDPDSPTINYVFEMESLPKVKGDMVYFEKFNPKKLFKP